MKRFILILGLATFVLTACDGKATHPGYVRKGKVDRSLTKGFVSANLSDPTGKCLFLPSIQKKFTDQSTDSILIATYDLDLGDGAGPKFKSVNSDVIRGQVFLKDASQRPTYQFANLSDLDSNDYLKDAFDVKEQAGCAPKSDVTMENGLKYTVVTANPQVLVLSGDNRTSVYRLVKNGIVVENYFQDRDTVCGVTFGTKKISTYFGFDSGLAEVQVRQGLVNLLTGSNLAPGKNASMPLNKYLSAVKGAAKIEVKNCPNH